MKKILVIALALVLALGTLALVACGGGEETKVGKCVYTAQGDGWSADYGCMVKVTVKGGVITKVVLLTNDEAKELDPSWKASRTTASWLNEADANAWNTEHASEIAEGKAQAKHGVGLGYQAAEAAYDKWIEDTFVNKTVEQVLAYEASASAAGQTVGTASAKLAGATQSAARIIVAVQDALKSK